MITYPRKCKVCEHIANNAAMYHYHKQTHQTISQNELCEGGCGQQAKYRKTNGRLTCDKNSHKCPTYKTKHSDQVKIQWVENQWNARRNRLATVRERMTAGQIDQHRQAQIRTKRQRRIATETTKGQRAYSRAVIYHSRKTYNQYKNILNPMNLPIGRGRNKYSLDHKVSRHVGWLRQIPVDIMSCVHNLQIILNIDNSSKSINCSLQPEQLIELANKL